MTHELLYFLNDLMAPPHYGWGCSCGEYQRYPYKSVTDARKGWASHAYEQVVEE